MDWVGLFLIGAVGVGGVVYYVKSRPIQPNGYADVGVPVPVVGQGQNFVVQNGGGGTATGTTGGQDAANVINSVTGLARGLFPNGIGGLFG